MVDTGYTTDVEIHDGPFNVIKNCDYAALVERIDNGDGQCWTAKVRQSLAVGIWKTTYKTSSIYRNLTSIKWGQS